MIEKTQPTLGQNESEKVQSDLTGNHKVNAVTTCDQNSCNKRFCDTIHRNICPFFKGESSSVTELAGAITHSVPKDKKGVLLSSKDFHNNKQDQFVIKEKAVIPVHYSDIKQNENATNYVQQADIVRKIANSLPLNSAYHLKNSSICDTAYDDNV